MLSEGRLSAAAIKKLDQQQMLAQLAEAVDLENASAEVKHKFAQISASVWTEEDRELGRELGRAIQQRAAEDRRDAWKEWAIKAFIDNYDCGQYLTRAGIINNIHTDACMYGHKGQRGHNIKKSTISRWLTEQVETEIRLEAIRRLIEQAKNL